MRRTIFFAVLVLIPIVFWWKDDVDDRPLHENTSLTRALGGNTEGWQRADRVREFHFPDDHGPHFDYKTEWWYFTGNLQTVEGRRFGYQLTIFRIGLKPGVPDNQSSAWRANHFYMGHFAVTDPNSNQFYRFERFSRGANQLAGAQSNPLHVWLDNWEIRGDGDPFPVYLRASQQNISIDFTLDTRQPPLLQGEHGLSRKSDELGNASYYYSYPRISTKGKIKLNNETFNVEGNSWLDREWSTSALGKNQAGWDWFSLQLDDGRDIMFYRMRRRDGAIDRNSTGVILLRNGTQIALRADDVELRVRETWKSPETKLIYPTNWHMKIASQQLDLDITPLLPQQEMNLTVRYWEGAVEVRDPKNPTGVVGRGYLELAGYE